MDVGTIFCFEPNPYYYKLLKKINFPNVIVKPYAIGTNNTFRYAYHPRYKFLNKNYVALMDADDDLDITQLTPPLIYESGKIEKLRKMIEKSKEDYEKIIDHATTEIESFIKKASSESSLQ